MPFSVVTVKQLSFYIKSLMESDPKLANINVVGEISDFKCHYASGHLYFTLKDAYSALKCVMFKSNASNVSFVPCDGMRVVCSGRISVFERSGAYQLYVENIVPDGQGDLMAQFEKLKSKLEAEGLFSAERKKAIPHFPKRVGVITSETGVAVRDIFNVLERRYPICEIVFCSATVQGASAPKSLCAALDKICVEGADVVIIGRGGGSVEDLWCFNDETLARKIAACDIPIISAVGHETDFTICDFVADLRAPTPSAAAELAVPDISDLRSSLLKYRNNFNNGIGTVLSSKALALKQVTSSRAFTFPQETICDRRMLMLDSMCDRIRACAEKKLLCAEKSFCTVATRLEALSPVKTMLRGFSVIEKDKNIVGTVEDVLPGDKIVARFSDGKAVCTVEETIKE